VVIDVEAQGQSCGEKSLAQELQMSQEGFALVESGADDQTAVVIHEMQEAGLPVLSDQPAMRGSIILPELAHALSLPAADRGPFSFKHWRGQMVAQGEAAHGGAVQFEVETAQDLRGHQAVGAGRLGLEQTSDQIQDRLGPRFAVVTAGRAGGPPVIGAMGASTKEGSIDFVEARPAEIQLGRSVFGREATGAKAPQHIADVRRVCQYTAAPTFGHPCSPLGLSLPPRERPKGEQPIRLLLNAQCLLVIAPRQSDFAFITPLQ
jgi:hypothetical protein